tara:strand:+ start:282 stop:533 length:252 start_codon:yes stop_codon:yes gene_type:complete
MNKNTSKLACKIKSSMFAQVIIDEILMLRISIILKEYSQMKNDIARYRIDIARYHILDIHVLKMAESDIARYRCDIARYHFQP